MKRIFSSVAAFIMCFCMVAAICPAAFAEDGSGVTISFNSNGGSEVASITQEPGTVVAAPAAPTKQGYDFMYWSLNGSYYPFTVMPESSIELTANWAPGSMTPFLVNVYEMNTSGEYVLNASTDCTGVTDSYMNLSSAAMAPPGFYIDEDRCFLEGTISPNGDTVFEIYHGRSKYDVTFSAAGGYFNNDTTATADIVNADLYYDTAITAPTVARDNFIFAGWSLDGEKYEVGNVPNDDIVLTAIWVVPHTVSFCDMFGNVINEQTIAVGAEAVIPTPAAVVGYRFSHWDIDVNADIYKNSEDDVSATGVYVIDSNNKYTVTVNGVNTSYTQYKTATASTDWYKNGELFSYWVDGDGNIVSYFRTYKFIVHTNIELTAVYGIEVTDQERAATRITFSEYNEDYGYLSVFAERSMSADFTVMQHGILLTDDATLGGNSAGFVFSGGVTPQGALKTTASSTGLTGMYVLTFDRLDTLGATIYARSYAKVIYDEKLYYVYGDIEQINNPLSQAPGSQGVEEIEMQGSTELDVEPTVEDEPTAEKTLFEKLLDIIMKIITKMRDLLTEVKVSE